MADRPTLPNAPLVEALVEIRWRLSQRPGAPPYDPHYKFLLGRLQEKISDQYPFIEALPTSALPEDFAPAHPTYRFRVAEDSWPLIQIGPGVLTVNETEAYEWNDFSGRVENAVDMLFAVHPRRDELQVENILVRYINAELISDHDFISFLQKELKILVKFPKKWFDDSAVEPKPSAAQWISQFDCHQPPGRFSLTLALGEKSGEPAVLWDLSFRSQGAQLPDLPSRFGSWFSASHGVIESWFFNLIEGSALEERYASPV